MESSAEVKKVRKATHAGSWYSEVERTLNEKLDTYLSGAEHYSTD